MSFKEFASASAPPVAASVPLRSLWFAVHGEWEQAHRCVQSDSTREGAWVHAWLHREQGDEANAEYWYAQAGRSPPASSLTPAVELEAIVRELLGET